MVYKVNELPDSKIIEVLVEGALDQETRKEILFNSVVQLNNTGFSKLLIDVSTSPMDPNQTMTDALPLVTYLKGIGMRPETKMAFIYSSGDLHRKHFENIAQLEGYSLRYFKDRNTAVEWLCQK